MPNDKVIILDSENEGMMYIKASDNIGLCSLRAFRFNEVTDGIEISRGYLWIGFFFVLITVVLYFRETRSIVANSAYANSAYGQAYSFLMQVSWARRLEGANVAYYVQQMFTCSEAIALTFAFILVYNKVVTNNRRVNYVMLVTIILFLVASILTSGRARMLSFFLYIASLWILLSIKKRKWKSNSNIRLVVRGISIVALAILVFWLAGFLTEKSLHYKNFADNFANYFSSGTFAFNEYVNNPSKFSDSSTFFGIHTLSGVYSFLRTLGFDIPPSIVSLQFIKCGDYTTNIYTALRRYYQDFGVIGLVLIMFLVGYIYKRIIWSNKKDTSPLINIVLSSYFLFPLYYIAIEERIFMDVILMRSVYMVIYLTIIFHLMIDKPMKRRERALSNGSSKKQ